MNRTKEGLEPEYEITWLQQKNYEKINMHTQKNATKSVEEPLLAGQYR